MTMFQSFFILDQKYYKQCDGALIGSPLGPTLTNVIMCSFEKLQLENCPTQECCRCKEAKAEIDNSMSSWYLR